MKHFYLFFILLLSIQAQGQKPKQKKFTPLETIPMYGVTLNNHWKWHEGDNPLWAKPDFDDGQWEKIDLSESTTQYPKLEEAGIAWFRRPVQVKIGLVNKPLFISISQMGASEIYLDGKLLYKIGVVNKNPEKEETQVKATGLPITFADTNKHMLAVRYSFTKDNFSYPGTDSEIFEFRIQHTKDFGDYLEEQANRTAGFLYFFTGIFLIFAILHFSFYFSNRERKVSLSLGLTMLVLTLTFFFRSVESYQSDVSTKESFGLASIITTYFGVFFINVSLYQYLSQKFGIIFYSLAFMVIGGMFCYIFDWNLPWAIDIWVPFLLLFVDFIRVSILAYLPLLFYFLKEPLAMGQAVLF
jgi:two-component system NtrC family sensor kinase